MDNLERAERTMKNFVNYLSVREGLTINLHHLNTNTKERGIKLHKLYESLINANRVTIDIETTDDYFSRIVNRTRDANGEINYSRNTEPRPVTKEELEMLVEAGLDLSMFDV
jgi:hypothetical protein